MSLESDLYFEARLAFVDRPDARIFTRDLPGFVLQLYVEEPVPANPHESDHRKHLPWVEVLPDDPYYSYSAEPADSVLPPTLPRTYLHHPRLMVGTVAVHRLLDPMPRFVLTKFARQLREQYNDYLYAENHVR